MTIFDYGFDAGTVPADTRGVPARITSSYSGYYKFFSESGSGVARLKKSAFLEGSDAVIPTTGDFVMLEWNPQGESRILATLPRRTKFERLDPSSSGRKAQVLAANFDTVLILMSLNQNFNVHRLERFVSLAWKSGATPVAVLTKADLVADPAPFLAEVRAAIPNVTVHAVSAKTGTGLEALAPYVLPRKTLVLFGSSGVGKSSLVNALAGDELMPTLEIREWDDKGRHTTTERELVVLPNGALVIDTPGLRELGMWDAGDGVVQTFADVEAFLGHCKFSDCRHESEPGCAVRAALESGTLPRERWEAYRRLRAETAPAADRALRLAAKKVKFKEIARSNKSNHRYRGE